MINKMINKIRGEYQAIPMILKKTAAACIAGYLLLTVLYFFLAGEQLHYRDSRSNMDMPVANTAAVELYEGNVVEQHFTTKIERLEKVHVQWSTFYRVNEGTAVIELYNSETNELLMSGKYNMADISEGGITTLCAEVPLEGIANKPLMLRLYSEGSRAGSAVSPLMTGNPVGEGAGLFLNGSSDAVDGTLCFAAEGTDYIWIGLHYWKLVAVGFLAVLVLLCATWRKEKKGGNSYIIGAIHALRKYRFLIEQLVARDFKTKYKRSVLGVFWSFLNPLLTLMVQFLVFSTLFRSDIPNYAAYLVIGIVCFNYFSEVCGLSLMSVLENTNLITKVYMPKYIYPMTKVLSSAINLVMSLIPMIIVCLLTGVQFHKSALLSLYFLVCLVIFCMGMAFTLSTAMVFFRDTQFLWGVVSMIWMYATALFYPESIIPDRFRFILEFNPLYHFIKNVRVCILDGISPEPYVYLLCLGLAGGMLLVGATIFKKCQDQFVLYL